MYSFSDKPITSVHLGLTWSCALKCPVCARTGAIKSKKDHQLTKLNLDWKKYRHLIDLPEIDTVLMCGNYGDPIYYKYLLELCTYIKTKSNIKSIEIHTNGSYKTQDFWKKLSDILGPNDMVAFSIDGTLQNSDKYRINSDSISIVKGINALTQKKDGPNVAWKHIIFPYNIETIEEAVNQAISLNFDWMQFENANECEYDEYNYTWNKRDIINRIKLHLLKTYKMYDIEVNEDGKCVHVDIQSLLNVSSET